MEVSQYAETCNSDGTHLQVLIIDCVGCCHNGQYRVLYLAMSPDGQSIVTGAGDETLRFWNVFPGPKQSYGALAIGSKGLMLAGGVNIR